MVHGATAARPGAAPRPRATTAGRPTPRPRGFTLLELVVGLVLLGLLAAALVVFLKPALDGFLGSRQRSQLLGEADQALRRMVRDVQAAVPNSIRSPSSSCFELVPTSSGGRLRLGPDTVAGGSAWVDTSSSTSSFDVLHGLARVPAVGDWVVVDNQNPGDVYAGTNRSAITGVSTPAAALGQHRLTISPLQFPPGYDSGRFVVVPDAQQAVFYVCSGASTTLDAQGNAPGTLVRLKRYGFNTATPTSCPAPAGGDLLATHVRSCRFLYDPNQGATQQSGYLSIQLELTRANETVSLVVGAHVVNVP